MDEIGNMSGAFQDRVLRVIEYQEFERVRGTETIRMDLRVISATNGDLNELTADKLFRQDLYDRLAFAVLKVSPLRRRRDEIMHMIVHFVQGLHVGNAKSAGEDISSRYRRRHDGLSLARQHSRTEEYF